MIHFNSLAPCGANLDVANLGSITVNISTHSPRVGRTYLMLFIILLVSDFNSLAPCGANLVSVCSTLHYEDFNSLAPCGANLCMNSTLGDVLPFQLTRPVWGEPRLMCEKRVTPRISTHSPRVGRTSAARGSAGSSAISTHSPRVGRTITAGNVTISLIHFNSLAPCGANRSKIDNCCCTTQFQLTRPVWGEPYKPLVNVDAMYISTHSPRVGRTLRRG